MFYYCSSPQLHCLHFWYPWMGSCSGSLKAATWTHPIPSCYTCPVNIEYNSVEMRKPRTWGIETWVLALKCLDNFTVAKMFCKHLANRSHGCFCPVVTCFTPTWPYNLYLLLHFGLNGLSMEGHVALSTVLFLYYYLIYISTTVYKCFKRFSPIPTLFWQIYTITADMWRSVTLTVFMKQLLRPLHLGWVWCYNVYLYNTGHPSGCICSSLHTFYIICGTQSIDRCGTTQGKTKTQHRPACTHADEGHDRDTHSHWSYTGSVSSTPDTQGMTQSDRTEYTEVHIKSLSRNRV